MLLFLPVVLSGCASVVSRSIVDPDRHWKHEVKLANLGAKRGTSWGVLYYRGRELPSYFDSLIISGSRYDYHLPADPGEPGGYQPDERHAALGVSSAPSSAAPSAAPASAAPINPMDLNRGWYLAGPQERKSGTPEEWVWVKRQNLEAFLDPAALNRFARAYRLSALPRGESRPGEDTLPNPVWAGVATSS